MWSIETNLFDNAVEKRPEPGHQGRVTGAFTDLASGNELHLLDRYESRLHRMYQRSYQMLMSLRKHDAPNEPTIENEPVQNEPVEPDAEPTVTDTSHETAEPPNEINMRGALIPGDEKVGDSREADKAAGLGNGAQFDPKTKLARLT
jgi:hypothetical protein